MTLVKFNNKTRNTAPYFNNVFDSLFEDALRKNYTINKMPSVNISESDADFKIELAAPGLKKEDFKIELKKDNLSVWVEKKQENTENLAQYTRKEFDYFSFARSFIVPEGVDATNINATYVDGILSISLAKKADEEHLQKEIKVL